MSQTKFDQLTVFLTNEKGRLAAMCRALTDADINMHSLFVADTEDFGVVRIVCDKPAAAAAALKSAGYRASVTPVVAVSLPNEKGGLAKLMEYMDAHDINVEYCYCFLANESQAIDVLKVAGDVDSITNELAGAGFTLVAGADVYALD